MMFECDFCGKKFKTMKELDEHMMMKSDVAKLLGFNPYQYKEADV